MQNHFNTFQTPPDPWAQTQATPRITSRRTPPPPPMDWMRPPRRRSCLGSACSLLIGPALVLLVVLALYFLAPFRTNLLILGMDYADWWTSTARTDTIMLATFLPARPYVGLLSIPRDLWVVIPGVGENRINTAHFFAEAAAGGSGPQAALDTVNLNFGLDLHYYVRVRFESVREIVNAMGGVDIDLPEPMAGYPAGRHHLTGNKALAFARDRANSDDFFRMQHAQLLVRAMLKQLIQPRSWVRLPAVGVAALRAVDTNLPAWLWPRLGLTLLRVGPDGIRSLTITRDDVTPYITDQGANVLLPNWPRIQARVAEMMNP